jgi:hypothetical protein
MVDGRLAGEVGATIESLCKTWGSQMLHNILPRSYPHHPIFESLHLRYTTHRYKYVVDLWASNRENGSLVDVSSRMEMATNRKVSTQRLHVTRANVGTLWYWTSRSNQSTPSGCMLNQPSR